MTIKRKLQLEVNVDENKMLKLNQTGSDPHLSIYQDSELSSGRRFQFELTDKKAKANLIKSAIRKPYEVEQKQRSTNLRFSAGAFLLIAKPFMKELQSKFESRKPLVAVDTEIVVEEFRDGIELNNKHFDTKLVLSVNKKKVVIHCYNSTQNMKIDGSNYNYFVQSFLLPLVISKSEELGDQISRYDCSVFTSLSARGRPIRPRTVKSVRSVIHQSNFTCKKCGYEFSNYNQFKKHKFTEHNTSFNSSENSLMSIRNSTRNNSFAEEMLLCEDISITGIKNSLEEEQMEKTSQEKCSCEKCERIFKTRTSLMNHECLSHDDKDIISIMSCDKCDFETEDKNDMDNHNTRDIHDTFSKNKTLIEDSIVACKNDSPGDYECHLCKYVTRDLKAMDEHTINTHGMVKCGKCAYSAEDQDLLDNHMKKHTGRIIFTCVVCEFEATREVILENHMELKHKKNTDRNTKCENCEKEFPALFLSRYHICGPQYTYPCQLCTFVAIDLEEIVSHQLEYHTNTLGIHKCGKCDYKTIKRSNIDIHQQTNHQNLKVDIDVRDQVQIQCDQCDYKCTLNIKLKKHKKRVHEDQDDKSQRFKCNMCDYTTDFVLYIWEHRQANHPNDIPQFSPQSKDMVLSLLANQVNDLLEEMGTLKDGLKNAFLDLVSFVNSSLVDIKANVNENLLETKKITDKLNKEDHAESVIKTNEQVLDMKDTKECVEEDKSIRSKSVPKKRTNSNLNVAWVGTSISNVLDHKKFEKDTNTNVTIVRACGIVEEFQDASPKDTYGNFKKIVPEVLDDEDVDMLVLEAGSLEISNIKVNEAIMDTTKDITEYKKEWFQQVEEDSKSIYKIAENAIKKKPNLKVIILKRMPRFDRGSQDILGIKSKLSTYANQTYDQLWLKSGNPRNIHIAELNLNIEGNIHLRNLIYGDNNIAGFDGVHLRGAGAARHFTYRSVQAIKAILPKSVRSQNSQKSRSQNFQKARSQNFLNTRSQNVRKEPLHRQADHQSQSHSGQYDHIDCPQAQYQRHNDHTDCPQARYQRQNQQARARGGTNVASYAEVVRGEQYGYTVPTYNRFSFLD